jgi:FKBP-type peptidyl-prolyl cis-trans isomerase SlyD
MRIEKNKVVSIRYVLRSPENEILDRSEEGSPLEYLHGAGSLIPGLERELEGKQPGDSFILDLEPRDGCGLYDDSLVMDMKREKFDTGGEITEGMEFEGRTENGEYRIFRVTAVKKNVITVDGNHPFAGRKLNFDIAVEAVRDATEDELAHAHFHAGGGCGGCRGECPGGCGCGC